MTLITLSKEMAKILEQLDKCRANVLQDGWQTQRFAKKDRKWDFYGERKHVIRRQIEDAVCPECDATECTCGAKEAANKGVLHLKAGSEVNTFRNVKDTITVNY